MKPRITHLLILFLVLNSLQISCKKDLPQDYQFPDPSTLPKGLKGTWLETTLRLDTILFPDNENKGNLLLECHYENQDFTMIYPYWISKDSIFIMDPTSSLSYIGDGLNFYFNFDEPKLTITIGNFTYRLKAKDPILIFRKIK
jgi:hypothetical protein